jgi:proton-translocating NADH-quinone oxidoreductase chain M
MLLDIILISLIISFFLVLSETSNKLIGYYVLCVNAFLIFTIAMFFFFEFDGFNLLAEHDGIDSFSLIFVLLTVMIFHSIYLYNSQFITFSYKECTLTVIILEGLILAAFMVNNILLFYFIFESLIFPMYYLIGVFGSRGRKIHAALQFMFYTLVSSIFILTGILVLYLIAGTLHFNELRFIELNNQFQIILAVLFFIGFSAKIPMMPLHIWLPEAHVEAPTIGSVLLAAILLKFGFYGMIRTIFAICSVDVIIKLNSFFFIICLISLIYSSFAAVRQIDLKRIVAYSSIAHMNFALLGIFFFQKIGLVGTTFLMFSHGLISGAMFFAIGLVYERFHTRNIIYYGGLVQFMPVFSIIFFILMFSNMSLPGTCNFIGEFFIFVSLFHNNVVLFVLSIFSILLVSLFSLIVLTRVVFYQITGFLYPIVDLNFCETLLFGVFPVYIILFGICPNLILMWL